MSAEDDIYDTNSLNIIHFYTKNTNTVILEKHHDFLKRLVEFCYEALGEGKTAKVNIIKVSDKFTINIKNTNITIRAVVKIFNEHYEESIIQYNKQKFLASVKDYENLPKREYDIILSTYVPNDTLIFVGNEGPNVETVILSFVSKLWYDSETPHVPFLIGPFACNDVKNNIFNPTGIDTLALEQTGYRRYETFKNNSIQPSTFVSRIFYSHFETLGSLLLFMLNDMYIKNDVYMAKLPNGIEVSISHFIDTVSLSFFFTYTHLFNRSGITMCDQHINNILIQWQDDYAFCGNRPLKNIKKIVYDISNANNEITSYDKNKKYYAINTNGFIIKLGDVGSSVLKVRDNLFFVGVANQNMVEKCFFINFIPCYLDFIHDVYNSLPLGIAKYTILDKILSSDEFSQHVGSTGSGLTTTTTIDFIVNYFDDFLYNPENETLDNEEIFKISLPEPSNSY